MRKRLTVIEGKQLWEEYQRGNIQSLGKLMQGYYPDLFHWGMRLHNERELVKDCIQEVFLNLWRLHESIPAVENVRAYLLMVLKSHMLRDLTNKHVMLQSSIQEDYSFSVEFSADMRMIEEEHEIYQIRKLEAAMNHLPKRQKELIYLRFHQNLSFEEIADVMNLGRQSAYNLFQKSLNNLRKHWPVLTLFTAIWIF
ncbi:sigma-70 family RNA polymerase sigma factor [Dyadobacter sp. LHD-138]|uniref:RNA polymerase sigma factor n=1 Tax=Dyadobacter sp. LHD-138 TaxID=3071413 RepID=UPI0027DF26EF|nr:sigma-70 family RNA polymerase sigma factor [Dyadobacter sp. LHD-138]MDQ6477234.1 sigma-70 family RNA polymerase sigma factor [Dyadobacter sp. LHD-138]